MAMTRNQRSRLLLAIYVLLLALTVALLWRLGAARQVQAQKVGFITPLAGEEQGVSAREGIRAACAAAEVELLLREGVAEGDGSCAQTVAELVKEGAEMIILASPAYSLEMEPLFASYPSVTFYGIFASSLSGDIPNLVSYSTRMYQARYLSGIVAGMYSRNGRIGFVASEQTSEVCRNINAFALGVRRAAPEAEVVVTWAGTEYEAAAGARALIEKEKVDLITYHQPQHTVLDAAERAGVASIGYYDRVQGASELCLTCAACDWTILYGQLLREYLQGLGNGSVVNEWLGLESDAVGLTAYSALVSGDIRAEVERARAEILSGLDVFVNEIYDNQGRLRCGQGESMTDAALLREIDWLVEGVRVYE